MVIVETVGGKQVPVSGAGLLTWSEAVIQDAVAVYLPGAQMTAWVEVPFHGYGWVAFDPLPDEAKPPPTQRPDENQSQAEPQRVQPPPPPIPPKDARAQSQEQPDTPDTPDEAKNKQQAPPPLPASPVRWGWILFIGAAGCLLILPIVLILLLKRRHRKRLAGGPPDQRIAGAWTHLLNTAGDYRRSSSAGATRVEAAQDLVAAFGAGRPTGVYGDGDAVGAGVRGAVRSGVAAGRAGAGGGGAEGWGAGGGAGGWGAGGRGAGGGGAAVGPVPTTPGAGGVDLALLAQQANARVFSPDQVEPVAADRYWAEMEKALHSMRRSQPGWRRLRARLSLASLRGAGR